MAQMNRSLSLLLIVVCAIFAFAGCRKGVPVQNHSSPLPVTRKVSDDSIANAIIRAGAITGWEIVKSGDRELIGTLLVRNKHTAMVSIAYDDKNYRITYLKSANLEYTGEKIHPNYNKWVNTLDSNIRLELARLNP